MASLKLPAKYLQPYLRDRLRAYVDQHHEGSIASFARTLGVDRTHAWSALNGRRDVPLAWCSLLGVKIEMVAYVHEEKPNAKPTQQPG